MPAKRRLPRWRVREPDAWDDPVVAGEAVEDAVFEEPEEDGDREEWATGEEAGRLLIDFLLDSNLQGHLSGKAVCIIAFWAAKAGAADPVGRFGKAPGRPTGHYQRHLDTVLEARPSKLDFQTIIVPKYLKADLTRRPVPTAVCPPHEVLHEEIESAPGYKEKLRAQIDEGKFSSNYFNHPVVRNTQELVAPIGLYSDGVKFANKDSVLGWWAINLVTGKRHLCAVLQKSSLCRCGCRGYDSVFAVLNYLRWSFTAAAEGRFPEEQHTGEPWLPATRQDEDAGEPMCMRMAVVMIKGDWMEFSTSYGFVGWGSTLFPCLHCMAEKEILYEVEDIDVNTPGPWPPLTEFDYKQAAERCETWVTLRGPEDIAALRNCLRFDKRKKGNRGRCLVADLPAYNLKSGDRLECSPSLPDPASLEEVSSFPKEIVFWRCSMETALRHRCPLFDTPGLHCSLVMDDILHALYMGPVQTFSTYAVWDLVQKNAWRVGGRTVEELDQLSILRLKHDLFTWYKRQPRNTYTEVCDLTVSMLGSRSDPSRQPFKGAEAKAFAYFLFDELHRFRVLSSREMYRAARSLVDLMNLTDACPPVPSEEEARAMLTACKQFIMFSKACGAPLTPKHHQLVHLYAGTMRNGAPNQYACWHDESLNKTLASIAAKAYASVWERRILSNAKKVF